MHIDLQRLKHLAAIARNGSFSRAAEELNLTQSALSRSVAAFEKQYGLRVFDRGRSGAFPTPNGKLVLKQVERLLSAAQELDQNLCLYGRGFGGRVAIGLGPLAASLILPRLSSALFRERPQLQLRAKIGSSEDLLQDVLSGHIEMIFSNNWKLGDQPDLIVSPLCTITLAMIVRSGHPLAGASNLSFEDLKPYPLASSIDFSAAGLDRGSPGIICDSYHILRETTLHTDSVCLGSPILAATDVDEGRLCILDLADFRSPENKISLIQRREQSPSSAATMIIDAAYALFSVQGN